MRYTKQEKEEARTRLLELLEKANYKVYTTLVHVSRSGMLRVIGMYVMVDNEPVRIHGYAAKLCDFYPLDKQRDGVRATGCGMDQGFAVVYNLSVNLYCPDKYDHDAAYKLHHYWM